MKPMMIAILTLICGCLNLLGEPVWAEDEQDSATYQWTDDSGTVNFSDNAANIAEQHRQRAQKRESVKGESIPAQAQENKANNYTYRPQPKAVAREANGAHNEAWWRGRYSGLREQIKQIKDGLSEKRDKLRVLQKNKIITDVAGHSTLHGHLYKNRTDYRDLYNEIEADEEKIPKLEQELEALELEAARAGVPLAWRR